MNKEVFQQDLDDKKGPRPGGPYLIQMLFKEPVEMPDKETMTDVMKKHTFRVWYLIANPRGLPKEFVQKELEFRWKLFPEKKEESK